MGFSYYHPPTWEITKEFLWIEFKLIIIEALIHLGLYKPIIPQQNILILDWFGRTSPSLKSAIKNRVPILHYREIVDETNQQEESKKEVLCTICLEKIQDNELVREVSRCAHVFHRDCLDKWIDSDQVTCPLCRSLFIPPITCLFRTLVQNSVQPSATE